MAPAIVETSRYFSSWNEIVSNPFSRRFLLVGLSHTMKVSGLGILGTFAQVMVDQSWLWVLGKKEEKKSGLWIIFRKDPLDQLMAYISTKTNQLGCF